MKKIVFVFCLIFLSACENNNDNFVIVPGKTPMQILLQDENYIPAGIAIPVYENIFVTSNLVFKKDEGLIWRQKKAEILFRDFSTDLVFFKIEDSNLFPTYLSDTPPVIGQTLFRFVDGEILESKILSVADETDEFTVSGIMKQRKNLGIPIFDEVGKVYGIFIGGDSENNTLSFLRSDKILKLFTENLLEDL